MAKSTVYEVGIVTEDGRSVGVFVSASNQAKAAKYAKADYPGCRVVSVRVDGAATGAWR